MCCLRAGVARHGGIRGGQTQAPILTPSRSSILAFNEWYDTERISMEPHTANINGPQYGEDNREFDAETGSKRRTRMVVVVGDIIYMRLNQQRFCDSDSDLLKHRPPPPRPRHTSQMHLDAIQNNGINAGSSSSTEIECRQNQFNFSDADV